jgi:lipoate---protein ligase
MKYLDLTLATPEENLACDEALLDASEAGSDEEVLRFWEAPSPFVVVGYANQVEREVQVDSCHRNNLPVLRRCTGGGTVLQGPGCLNYSLILEIQKTSALASIPATNRFIMESHRQVFSQLLGAEVKVSGHTDLALDTRKFSGNAQRRKRRCLLFHGTFLLGFDLTLIDQALAFPSQQPTYRANRAHVDFVRNVLAPADCVKEALRQRWDAKEPLERVPMARIEALAREKYSRPEWNLKF